jgi:hypothetical protein
VSKRTRTSRSSFRRLAQYMTTERDSETGISSLRGNVLLSNNLLDFDTAAYVMQATAEKNRRCDEPGCHYELWWPPGEMPTREQWIDCASYTLRELGYGPIRSRSTHLEAGHSTEAARAISQRPPLMGSGQGQRGRRTGGCTTSRMRSPSARFPDDETMRMWIGLAS